MYIEPEDYIIINLKRTERSILAQLRAGTLPLVIEKGRFKKELLQQRLCTLCNQSVREDYINFVTAASITNFWGSNCFLLFSRNVDESFTELSQENNSYFYLNAIVSMIEGLQNIFCQYGRVELHFYNNEVCNLYFYYMLSFSCVDYFPLHFI